MNRTALSVALAGLVVASAAPAQAQRGGAVPVLVVDSERVAAECTACRAAAAQLQQQVQQAQQYAQQLANPLQPERQALETAINALNGKQPDAALQQRIRTFQTREAQVGQQLAPREQTLRSTQAHVNQQIAARVGPIIEQVRNARGALVVLAKGNTFASAAAADVTNDVLAELNRQLPSVSVTPLPQQQGQPQQPAGQQPQGR